MSRARKYSNKDESIILRSFVASVIVLMVSLILPVWGILINNDMSRLLYLASFIFMAIGILNSTTWLILRYPKHAVSKLMKFLLLVTIILWVVIIVVLI